MMAEIFKPFYAPHFTTDLLPPGNAGKTFECIIDFRLRHIVKPRCYRSHRRVAHIEFADQRNLENVLAKLESCASNRISDVSNSLSAILREADFNHRRQAISCDFHAFGIVAIEQYHAILRNDIKQTPETELDFVEVVEDVGVIKFDVIYDQ